MSDQQTGAGGLPFLNLTGIYSVPLVKPPDSTDLTLSNK